MQCLDLEVILPFSILNKAKVYLTLFNMVEALVCHCMYGAPSVRRNSSKNQPFFNMAVFILNLVPIPVLSVERGSANNHILHSTCVYILTRNLMVVGIVGGISGRGLF